MNKSFITFGKKAIKNDWLYVIGTCILLVCFTYGVLKNLGNTAFWEDEGETVQLGKTILKYGYPSVFDGRSFFITEPDLFRKDNFARVPSPYLQFYLAAITLKLNNNIADTRVMRLPFAIFALIGILGFTLLIKRLKYSYFTIFTFTLLTFSSIQLYLFYRQARHYALQFPIELGLIYTYLNITKQINQILFIFFSVLFFNTFYPGFIAIYAALTVHQLFLVVLKKDKEKLKVFITSTFLIALIVVPELIYLKQYNQVLGSGLVHNLTAYFYDYNYNLYFKIFYIVCFLIILMQSIKYGNIFAALNKLKVILLDNNFIFLCMLILIIVPLVLSFGRHNVRYISLIFPIAFFMVAYMWDQAIETLKPSKEKVLKPLSIPLIFLLISLSHPKYLVEVKQYNFELNSTYIGPIEAIVNTILNKNFDRINAYNSKKPNLLIATNSEEQVLYSYLDSQFLSGNSYGKYRYGERLPDWIIPRHDELGKTYEVFLKAGNYERINTNVCDPDFEQRYSLKNHRFTTPTECSVRLVLYKLK